MTNTALVNLKLSFCVSLDELIFDCDENMFFLQKWLSKVIAFEKLINEIAAISRPDVSKAINQGLYSQSCLEKYKVQKAQWTLGGNSPIKLIRLTNNVKWDGFEAKLAQFWKIY